MFCEASHRHLHESEASHAIGTCQSVHVVVVHGSPVQLHGGGGGWWVCGVCVCGEWLCGVCVCGAWVCGVWPCSGGGEGGTQHVEPQQALISALYWPQYPPSTISSHV